MLTASVGILILLLPHGISRIPGIPAPGNRWFRTQASHGLHSDGPPHGRASTPAHLSPARGTHKPGRGSPGLRALCGPTTHLRQPLRCACGVLSALRYVVQAADVLCTAALPFFFNCTISLILFSFFPISLSFHPLQLFTFSGTPLPFMCRARSGQRDPKGTAHHSAGADQARAGCAVTRIRRGQR